MSDLRYFGTLMDEKCFPSAFFNYNVDILEYAKLSIPSIIDLNIPLTNLTNYNYMEIIVLLTFED